MNFKELEKELLSFGLAFTSKKANCSFENEFNSFNVFLEKMCFYNQECIKIANNGVFNVQTLKDAKQAIFAFRLNLTTLNMFARKTINWIKNGQDISMFAKELFKIKKQFEDIMATTYNYQFKKNGRIYEIMQDKEFNDVAKNILRLFEEISTHYKNENQYSSFIKDIDEMKKRYINITRASIYDLEDADVVSKT